MAALPRRRRTTELLITLDQANSHKESPGHLTWGFLAIQRSLLEQPQDFVTLFERVLLIHRVDQLRRFRWQPAWAAGELGIRCTRDAYLATTVSVAPSRSGSAYVVSTLLPVGAVLVAATPVGRRAPGAYVVSTLWGKFGALIGRAVIEIYA